MQSPYTYDAHQHLEAGSARKRERDLSHMRALKDAPSADGLVSRIVGALGQVRPAAARQIVLTYDLRELKDAVCRLADGAMGRVTVRESDGVWVAVCVPD